MRTHPEADLWLGLAVVAVVTVGGWLWTRGKAPVPATELESVEPEYLELVDHAIDTACASYPTARRCRQIAACR